MNAFQPNLAKSGNTTFIKMCVYQEGMVFQLKQEAFSLIVYVARVPIFNISERPYDRNDQFVLSLNQPASNTSAV